MHAIKDNNCVILVRTDMSYQSLIENITFVEVDGSLSLLCNQLGDRMDNEYTNL